MSQHGWDHKLRQQSATNQHTDDVAVPHIIFHHCHFKTDFETSHSVECLLPSLVSSPRGSFYRLSDTSRGGETDLTGKWKQGAKLGRPKLLMWHSRSRNREGLQCWLRLLFHCNLTNRILNNLQKHHAWYKYRDLPFFFFLAVILEVFVGSDWLQITADSMSGNEKRHRWEATSSNSARTLLRSPLKALPSTTAAHYRLWQGIPEPNLELNRLRNTRNLHSQRENQQKVPALECFIFFFRAGGVCITEGFLEALTEWKGLH